MPLFDLPLDHLRSYRPAVAEPDDFDDFWERTLVESRTVDAGMSLVPVESGLSEVDVVDVTFPGFAGDPIKGWFLTPRHRPGRLPAIVEYLGYGGGRGLPHDRLAWVAAGYAHFVMDTRGQGSAWGSGGETPDPHGSGPATPGFLTRGIDDPQSYYYRRVYTDAVRAVDAVRQLDRVDAGRVAVCGGSQGGGIAIAVAGLVKDVRAVMPDVPFLSHFSRAFELVDRDPYAEVVKYLSVHRDREDAVRRTLTYFDGVSFARRAQAPALYSVALMDPVCPPSTVFASFNQYGGPAEIEVYPYNQHEGGGAHHWRRQAQWLSGLA
jgi:cephalosporin-C deacetylase